jgi:rubrerythrin
MIELVALLEEGRTRERGQTLFYRFLAGDAETAGDAHAAERLNGLLADEQHHFSRLTARLLELGERPENVVVATPETPPIQRWEGAARSREEDEVRWYTEALERVSDRATRGILEEILTSELHHRDELSGKWMPAALTDPQEET